MIKTWEKREWRPLLYSILLLLSAFFVGQFVGLLALLPLFGGDLQAVEEVMTTMPLDKPGFRIVLMTYLGVTSLCTFILYPAFYARFIEKRPFRFVFSLFKPRMADILIALGLMALFFVLDIELIRWNQNWEWLRQFEWAVGSDEQNTAIQQYLLEAEGLLQVVMLVVIVSVLPGIGEELVFRGLLQRNIYWATNRAHLAIWLGAILFSAIHMQFLGFFPRMAMGVLFGYMYWWSGNLWLPIIAHAVNNGFTVLAVQTARARGEDVQLDEVEPSLFDLQTVSGWAAYLAVMLVFGLALFLARRYWLRRKPDEKLAAHIS